MRRWKHELQKDGSVIPVLYVDGKEVQRGEVHPMTQKEKREKKKGDG